MNRIVAATVFALLGFAANSVLCRMALRDAHIDPASFMSIRLVAGALTLWLLVCLGRPGQKLGGHWGSALTLLAYAIAFTFAYVGLTAGTGALLLFGAVESLIEHRASIEGPQSRTPQNLLRLSVGIEEPADLIADLDQALE